MINDFPRVKSIVESALVDAWLDYIDGTITKVGDIYEAECPSESWIYDDINEIKRDAIYTINEWLKEGCTLKISIE